MKDPPGPDRGRGDEGDDGGLGLLGVGEPRDGNGDGVGDGEGEDAGDALDPADLEGWATGVGAAMPQAASSSKGRQARNMGAGRTGGLPGG